MHPHLPEVASNASLGPPVPHTVRPARTVPGAGRIEPSVGPLRALVTLFRPRQWVKNALVLAAPLAAGVLTDVSVLRSVGLALLALCLASGATYAVNDVLDREADRRHPAKRHRPVASGAVGPTTAVAAAVAALFTALLLAALGGGAALAGVVAGYVALTTTYSLHLKHVPIADVAAIAGGFVLRAVAGAVAAGVVMSDWFVVVVSACALFLAVGKRFSELQNHGTKARRGALSQYTAPFLRHLLFLAATVAIVSYGAWAFDVAPWSGSPWLTASIAPFAIALLTYALLVEQGEAEAPEDVLLHDRVTQVLGATWAVLFVVGVYV